MRIVEVTPRFPPAIGGMENHVLAISTELTRRGHEVIVVTSDDTDEITKREMKSVDLVNGIAIHRYPLLFTKIMREYWFLHSTPAALSNLHPDIVHAHGYRCLSSCLAAYWCKTNRVPFVLTPHGIYPPRSLTNASIKFAYDHTLGNLLLKCSNKIVALTENNRELLLKMGASQDKIIVVPNGVDVDKCKNVHVDIDAKIRQGLEGRVMLYVGRIDWNKGLEMVVRAMPRLKKKFGQIKFLIVGPDYAGHSQNLLNLARELGVSDSVILAGRVAEEKMLFCYSVADIFVLPSLYEGLSLSLLEAMAWHVPVVTSNSGGLQEVFVDRVHALLLRNCSPEEISDSISLLLNDGKLMNKLRENAFSLVSEKYSWQRVADKLESIYDELVSANLRSG
jgi:glycosyltransferase involved in cell wall biosynthesis